MKTRFSTLALAATALVLLAAGNASATPLKELGHGPAIPAGWHTSKGSGGIVISCGIGGCTKTGGDRDPGYGDHDHDHDHDYRRYYWDHWHGWRLRPEFLIEGVPAPIAAPVAVEAVPARVPAAVAPVAQAPCNCLTKQTLADGSVLFQDICTKESAIAAPQVSAR